MRRLKKAPSIGIDKIAMTFACAVGLLLLAIGAVATPVDSPPAPGQISVSAIAPLTGITPAP